jgi:hypothetical protein
MPGRVQIVVKPLRELAATEQGDRASSGTVLCEVENLGPLERKDLSRLHEALVQRLQDREQKLAHSEASAQDSAALLAEAELLLDAATAKAAMRALDAGSYVTTRQGAETPPLTLPEAEVLLTGAMRDGSGVNVTIVMPWRDHTELAQARQYYDAVLSFDDSEKARKFNALPDAERLPLARQIDTILRKPDPKQDELRFVRQWIGFDTHFSPAQGLVFLAPR